MISQVTQANILVKTLHLIRMRKVHIAFGCMCAIHFRAVTQEVVYQNELHAQCKRKFSTTPTFDRNSTHFALTKLLTIVSRSKINGKLTSLCSSLQSGLAKMEGHQHLRVTAFLCHCMSIMCLAFYRGALAPGTPVVPTPLRRGGVEIFSRFDLSPTQIGFPYIMGSPLEFWYHSYTRPILSKIQRQTRTASFLNDASLCSGSGHVHTYCIMHTLTQICVVKLLALSWRQRGLNHSKREKQRPK